MKDLSEKLKLLFKPFLVISLCFIVTYSFLHWLLFIQAGIPLNEEIIKIWLPFGLPWIPILIWLRPRIKLLNFKNHNGSFGYQFIAAMAIAVPAVIAQEYLVTATGKLTQLENVSQFEQKKITKYYSLKNYFIDKNEVGVITTATISGKNNETVNYGIYVALPILNNILDTANGECSYFIGKKYATSLKNNLSDQEKEEQFKTFTTQSQNEFDSTNFQNFIYLEKLGHSDDHVEFDNAIMKGNYVRYKDPIVFVAQNEPFEKRNGKKLEWTFISFGIGLCLWFIFLLFPKFNALNLTQFKKGVKIKYMSFKEMFDLLIPKDAFFVTPILLNINIIVYIIMVFAGLGLISFKGIDLLHWGANYRPYTTNGQWWRLLTSAFLHGGIMHIMANMTGLLFIGVFLEPMVGRRKYALIYLLTGIIASIASIWWHEATISIGASGAIFGLYGFFLAALLLKVFPPDFGKAFLGSALVFVGFNLLMGLTGGIDNAAHIGGLLSGFIIGLIMSPFLKREIPQRQNEGKRLSAK
jgi:rhomboid protease GluP